MLNSLHKQLLNDFQHDFPLSAHPYQEIAKSLGVREEDVISALIELRNKQFISRIGPVIPPNRIGSSMLAAMAIPAPKLAEIAEIVNRHPEVNHNYEREHRFNLWFVIIGNDENHLQTVIDRIEQSTECKIMQLPLVHDYHIDLGFELDLNHA